MTSRNILKRLQKKVSTPLGVLIIVVAALVWPVYSVRSSGSRSKVLAGAKATNGMSVTQRSNSSAASNSKSRQAWMSTGSFLPAPPFALEAIQTFASDCITPKTDFALGETVCAQISGAPLGSSRAAARIGWISPYGSLTQGGNITTDPQNATYLIPTSQTQTFTDSGGATVVVDNRGTWHVNTYSALDGSLRARAEFTVHDPVTPFVDLYATQDVSQQEAQVNAGSSSVFHLFITNNGPDAAANAVLTDDVPANTTLVAIVQSSGPTFSCTGPAAGGTGTITCTITSLARGDAAAFDLAYTVDPGAAAGTVITNTVTVSSATAELNTADNSSTALATVVAASTGGGSGVCSVGCPDDVAVVANTTQGGQDGAVVHFSPPSGNTECGVIVTDHCNDCFFPTGITTVTATAATGDTCSFTVTVNPANSGNATIVCPANQTVNADNDCQAVVNIGAPVASGNNVTIVGVRSDGKPLYNCDCFPNSPDQANDSCNIFGGCSRKNPDAPFSAGVTTITWTAITHDTPGPYATPADEEAHRTGSASCTQTITVNDTTPPVITATSSTVSADANCQAVVPDYSNQVTDNCACAANDNSQDCVGQHRITTSQDPAAGTVVGLGPHTIHLTANDGSSNNGGAGNTTTKDVVLTVADTTPPTFTSVPPDVTVYTGPGATTCDTVVSNATLGTPTATDNCSSVTFTRSPSGNTFSVGTTTITWTATDQAGNHSSATQHVTVIDNTPPVITLNGSAPSMWPPNHKYQTFTVTNFVSSVSDNCGGVSVGGVVIDHVTSDETENGNGDGNTANDIVIASDCKSVQLRSERDGGGDGRVYTITFRLRDTHGNTTTVTANVVVPHNPGETPVNSGVHYTVNGTCP